MFTAHRLLLATLALAACDSPELDPTFGDEVQFRCTPPDPLCGTSGGNTPFTGLWHPDLSALDTAWGDYDGTVVQSLTLPVLGPADSFRAHKGELLAKIDGIEHGGYALEGAVFEITVDTKPITLTITDVVGPDPGNLYWHYTIFYDSPELAYPNPIPACLPAAGLDFGAVVQSDMVIDAKTGDISARPNTLFIACVRGVMGEASYEPLGYGFRPFSMGLTRFEWLSRMIRADYCGDGTPWTVYGNPLAQRNKFGLGDDLLTGRFDAVWGPDGALCLGERLRPGFDYDTIDCGSKPKPPKCTAEEGLALYDSTSSAIAITHTDTN